MAATDRSAVLAMLRSRVARIEGRAGGEPDNASQPISICEVVDEVLPDGGLARGAVHEIAAASAEDDSGATFAFSALMSGRAGGTTIWIEPTPSIWPAGAMAFGLDPASLVLVAARGADGLWAAEQALRSPGVGSCVLVGTIPDLTASRRLQLAAEEGGTLGLSLIPRQGLSLSSAARTRWMISSAEGTGATNHDLGAPCWRVQLAAGKGCRPDDWILRWEPDTAALVAATSDGSVDVPGRQFG